MTGGKGKVHIRNQEEETHLGINRMRSARTKPTVTSKFEAGNTKGNTNKMNPNTIGT